MLSEADKLTRQEVYNRDKGRCVLCNRKDVQIHEIVPRSRFGRLKQELLFSPKNRVCLCVSCHADAHNFQSRKSLLQLLKAKHDYLYLEDEFRRYFE